jgi:tRNA dimethylallyltransferase
VPGLELVSVDAMAVYRGLDIGTETPRDCAAPWHLIDIVEPAEDFSVAEFQAAARACLEGIHARGHRCVLVGGTGLYHRAVVDGLELPGRYPAARAVLEQELAGSQELAGTQDSAGTQGPHSQDLRGSPQPAGLGALYERLSRLDPLAASRIEPGNVRRILRALEVTVGSGRPYSSFGPGLRHYGDVPVAMAGLALDRAEIDRRLAARLESELQAGFLEEVAALSARPGGLSRTARQAIGYGELLAVVEDGASLATAKTIILKRLKSFARRQEAWFRRDPRVTWFPADDPRLADKVLDWWLGTAGAPGTVSFSARSVSWETASK